MGLFTLTPPKGSNSRPLLPKRDQFGAKWTDSSRNGPNRPNLLKWDHDLTPTISTRCQVLRLVAHNTLTGEIRDLGLSTSNTKYELTRPDTHHMLLPTPTTHQGFHAVTGPDRVLAGPGRSWTEGSRPDIGCPTILVFYTFRSVRNGLKWFDPF